MQKKATNNNAFNGSPCSIAEKKMTSKCQMAKPPAITAANAATNVQVAPLATKAFPESMPPSPLFSSITVRLNGWRSNCEMDVA